MSTDYSALLQRAYDTIEEMQARLARNYGAVREPIAIVGYGLRFPGGARDGASFWKILHDGIDVVTEVPPDRWDVDAYYDADPDAVGKSYSRWAACLDEIDRFDAQFFGISPREAAAMDPQQRLLLEVSWEALEHAGHAGAALQGSRTGVFVGMVASDYGVIPRGNLNIDAYFGTGVSRSIAAGRISYSLGLRGPSIAIDTACSSSAVATHLACQSLWLRECDAALAGGANLVLVPDGSVSASRARMMSFTGRCRAFAASADGYVRAEGCAMLVLRRLSDALADNDNILAVILGSAVNQDGRSNGITAPNGQAQEQLLRVALADAGLTPDAVDLIEAHGTGTPLGDPIEMRAIGAVFGSTRTREQPLMVSSIKTNIGHTEAMAGTAGLLKLVLALEHGIVPPHLHLDEPNPHIAWDALPVTVPTVPTPWPKRDGARRIAGVSSFGFSGTNSHIIIAEPPPRAGTAAAHEPWRVLTLAAKSAPALYELAERYADHLAAGGPAFHDVTFTANTGRTHHSERLAVRAASRAEAAAALRAWRGGTAPDGVVRGTGEAGSAPEVAFLFTGQGAQYPHMGRRLYEVEPVFRAAIDRCDELLRPHLERPLRSVLHPQNDADAALIHQTAYTQPALFAIEYALAEVWRARGITPAYVMGHSIGEYVAAHVAGVFSLEDGLALIAARGRLMQALPAGGAMAAVLADEATVRAAVEPFTDRLAVAAVNGPRSIVISGACTALDQVIARFAEAGVGARRLTVSHAFHSPLLEPMLDEFAALAARVPCAPPRIGLVSNVTGTLAGAEITSGEYWRRHARAAVRFSDAVRTLAREGCSAFLEIGPGPTLIGMAQRCIDAPHALWLTSLHPDRDDAAQMLDTLATLHVHGVDVDWRSIENAGAQRVPLPTYPFQRQRYWANFQRGPATPARPSLRPLLGERLRSPAISGHLFQSSIGRDAPAWLDDHRIFDVPLFPATGFLELAWAAVTEALGSPAALEDVQIREALALPDVGEVTVQVALDTPADGAAVLRVFSLGDAAADKWTLHASANVRIGGTSAAPAEPSLDDVRARCAESFDVEEFYRGLDGIGVNYGPAFRGLRDVRRRDGEALARVELPPQLAASAGAHHLHPALLDGCLQLLGPAIPGATGGDGPEHVYVPVEIGTFTLLHAGAASVWCRAAVGAASAGGEVLDGELHLFDETGAPIGNASGVKLRRVSRQAIRRAAGAAEDVEAWLYDVVWQPAEIPAAGPAWAHGAWLIVADRGGIADAVAARMSAAGGTCTVVRGGDHDAGAYAATLNASGDGGPLRGIVSLAGADAADTTLAANAANAANVGNVADAAALDAECSRLCTGTLALAQAIAASASPPRALWLVTRGAHALPTDTHSVDPARRALWGLGPTIAAEMPGMDCVCIDIAPAAVDEAADQIVAELAAAPGERRVAWRGRARHVARLVRHAAPASSGSVELAIDARGQLDELVLRAAERREPRSGEVEIEVHASGLNFRDVLNALGMYPGDAGPLGSECAGVICAVGADVAGLQVGDRVLAIAPGTFRSHVTVPMRAVYPVPPWLALDEAASIPIVFLTAWYGLHELARIRAGDHVLIHAAAGGVGLAAVQLAQRAGAIVHATAGSEEKRTFLRGLGVEHVLSSRTLEFEQELMQSTGGAGVDVVLNALADEFIPASLRVLTDGGCFLELGKRGVWTQERVAALNPKLRYHVYDLADPMRDTGWLARTLDLLLPAFERGELSVLPLQRFALADASLAFRYMARARHIGKIVLTQQRAAWIRPEASYLVTGGLSGLGLEVARWLAAEGARTIVLMGRSAPGERAREVAAALSADGVHVHIARGDVGCAADVARVVGDIRRDLPPLRGVIHAAGVLNDGLIRHQDAGRFAAVMRPKVLGSLHLHEATRGTPLDLFLLFSTGSAFMGSAGQSNYAAANAFLDGLAEHRRSVGLPATTINWGAWSEVGMAAALQDRDRERWHAHGLGMIAPADGVRVLDRIVRELPPHIAVLPFDWTRYTRRAGASADPLLSTVARAQQTTPSAHAAARFVDTLRDSAPDARRELLVRHVNERVARVLGLDSADALNPTRGLSDLGMDSLMAVELSSQLQASLGCSLPSTLAFEQPTLAALTDFLADLVLDDLGPEPDVEPDAHVESARIAVARELTEEEAELTLLRELQRAGY